MEPSRERRLPDRRKAILVHSRLQGRPALLFLLLAAACAAAFVPLFLRAASPHLRTACTMGHYCPTFSATEVVGPVLTLHVAVLSCLFLLAGTVLLAALSARITAGLRSVCDTLRRSSLGDLSTPTEGDGAGGTGDLAAVLDRGARRRLLERIRAVREEADSLAAEPPPAGELRKRLAGLERALREVAP